MDTNREVWQARARRSHRRNIVVTIAVAVAIHLALIMLVMSAMH